MQVSPVYIQEGHWHAFVVVAVFWVEGIFVLQLNTSFPKQLHVWC